MGKVLRQLSKGRLSKETFVRGDFCPTRLLSKETFVQGMFVQGTFVQGDFCPRRFLSKETFVRADFCPKLSEDILCPMIPPPLTCFFFYWNTTICEILISTWTIVSLDKSLLGQKSPWTIVSLDNCLLGQMSPWTIVFLGQKSPWTIVPTPIIDALCPASVHITRRSDSLRFNLLKFLVTVTSSIFFTFPTILLIFLKSEIVALLFF